jgi:hypothetical protein
MVLEYEFRIAPIEIVTDNPFQNDEYYTWNEMRPHVEGLGMSVNTGAKACGNGIRDWPIAMMDMNILLGPLWEFAISKQLRSFIHSGGRR